jgi:hypothetical protein
MNTVHRILIGLSIAMLVPAAGFAQKVSYDVAHLNGIPRVSTFAIKDTPATTDDDSAKASTYDSPLVEARVREAVVTELRQRGLREVHENPDVYVTIHRSYKTEVTYYSYPDWGVGYAYGWGYGPWYNGWGPWYGGATWYADERVMGTLMVDMEDAHTGQLIWRGVGEKHVHQHEDPEDRTERVNKVVDKIFRKFPPVQPVVATSGSSVPKPTGR